MRTPPWLYKSFTTSSVLFFLSEGLGLRCKACQSGEGCIFTITKKSCEGGQALLNALQNKGAESVVSAGEQHKTYALSIITDSLRPTHAVLLGWQA